MALAYGPDGPNGPNGPNGQDGRARLRPDGLRRGKPRDNPRVCGVVGRWGAWGRCAAGVYAGNVMATAVCSLRGRDACV